VGEGWGGGRHHDRPCVGNEEARPLLDAPLMRGYNLVA
jgi:hypothetical protein